MNDLPRDDEQKRADPAIAATYKIDVDAPAEPIFSPEFTDFDPARDLPFPDSRCAAPDLRLADGTPWDPTGDAGMRAADNARYPGPDIGSGRFDAVFGAPIPSRVAEVAAHRDQLAGAGTPIGEMYPGAAAAARGTGLDAMGKPVSAGRALLEELAATEPGQGSIDAESRIYGDGPPMASGRPTVVSTVDSFGGQTDWVQTRDVDPDFAAHTLAADALRPNRLYLGIFTSDHPDVPQLFLSMAGRLVTAAEPPEATSGARISSANLIDNTSTFSALQAEGWELAHSGPRVDWQKSPEFYGRVLAAMDRPVDPEFEAKLLVEIEAAERRSGIETKTLMTADGPIELRRFAPRGGVLVDAMTEDALNSAPDRFKTSLGVAAGIGPSCSWATERTKATGTGQPVPARHNPATVQFIAGETSNARRVFVGVVLLAAVVIGFCAWVLLR